MKNTRQSGFAESRQSIHFKKRQGVYLGDPQIPALTMKLEYLKVNININQHKSG